LNKRHLAVHNQSIKGFSLLELLLVIVVISIIALVGINAVRQYATTVMVEKTANTMKKWLQSSVEYYIDNEKWPSSSDDLENYLLGSKEGQLSTNPWNQPYSFVDSTDPDLGFFQIQTIVPTEALAKRVAGLLTDVKVDKVDKDVVVIASVSKPLLIKPAGPDETPGPQLIGEHIEWIGFLINDGTNNNSNYVIPIPDCSQYDYDYGGEKSDIGGVNYPVLLVPPSFNYSTDKKPGSGDIELVNYELLTPDQKGDGPNRIINKYLPTKSDTGWGWRIKNLDIAQGEYRLAMVVCGFDAITPTPLGVWRGPDVPSLQVEGPACRVCSEVVYNSSTIPPKSYSICQPEGIDTSICTSQDRVVSNCGIGWGPYFLQADRYIVKCGTPLSPDDWCDTSPSLVDLCVKKDDARIEAWCEKFGNCMQ